MTLRHYDKPSLTLTMSLTLDADYFRAMTPTEENRIWTVLNPMHAALRRGERHGTLRDGHDVIGRWQVE